MALASTSFPDKETLAHAFFEEATRHLEDARMLHEAGRCPASITSSMKAAELGLKSILILDGALGWWDKLMTTHKPGEEISGHKILSQHILNLNAARPNLFKDVRLLEQLEPTKPGAQQFVTDNEANPEYPFVGETTDSVTGRVYAKVYEPRLYFDYARSAEAFGIARDVLAAIQTAYPAVTAWQTALPDAL